MSSADRQTEIEATLAVVSPSPDETGDQIAALRSPAGYRLFPRSKVVLHDVYWDLPDGRLGAQHIALRSRTTDRERLLTLKGRACRLQTAGVERLEIEESWSEPALASALQALEALGLAPDIPDGSAWSENLDATLRTLGFIVLQDAGRAMSYPRTLRSRSRSRSLRSIQRPTGWAVPWYGTTRWKSKRRGIAAPRPSCPWRRRC
jgi:hypothetical protein